MAPHGDKDCQSFPVPHLQRELVIAGDGFLQCMRNRGWSVMETRSIYTDKDVVRQPWLICPNGATYFDRTFYELFGVRSFRTVLRTILSPTPFYTQAMLSLFSDKIEYDRVISFLLDQELLTQEGAVWKKGIRLFQIRDIGHTLEWYVAEWFRLNLSIKRLIPVRHGVTLHSCLNLGDIDVVVLLDRWILMIECKSSPRVSNAKLLTFLNRARKLWPAISILLIDTSTLSGDGCIKRLNDLLAEESLTLLIQIPLYENIYWSQEKICVASLHEFIAHSGSSLVEMLAQCT